MICHYCGSRSKNIICIQCIAKADYICGCHTPFFQIGIGDFLKIATDGMTFKSNPFAVLIEGCYHVTLHLLGEVYFSEIRDRNGNSLIVVIMNPTPIVQSKPWWRFWR